MTCLILSEYRKGDKVVLIEKLQTGENDPHKHFRVSEYRSFDTIAKAQASYLSGIPANKHNYYANEIKANNKNSLSE